MGCRQQRTPVILMAVVGAMLIVLSYYFVDWGLPSRGVAVPDMPPPLPAYLSEVYKRLLMIKSFSNGNPSQPARAIRARSAVTILWFNDIQWLNIGSSTSRPIAIPCRRYGVDFPVCRLTSDHRQLAHAHVVSILLKYDGLEDKKVLEATEGWRKGSSTRINGVQNPQLWVAASIESPMNTPVHPFLHSTPIDVEASLTFNATLTYERAGLRQASNPYGHLELVKDNMPIGPLASIVGSGFDEHSQNTKRAIISAQLRQLRFRIGNKTRAQKDEANTIPAHIEGMPTYRYTTCWVVSHSHAHKPYSSHRELFVSSLQDEGVPVAVFGRNPGGRASNNTEKKANYMRLEQLKDLLSNKCLYYLAFENSIATDYITEKFYRSLSHGAVPIVLGPPRGDYVRAVVGRRPNNGSTEADISLRNSFIHFTDGLSKMDAADVPAYSNPLGVNRLRDLATFYRRAAKGIAHIIASEAGNSSKYLSHFDWLRHSTIVADDIDWKRGLCNTCKLYSDVYQDGQGRGFVDLARVASLGAPSAIESELD
eukprot:GILI01026029.1.p1 GENE.GILI01026029.1~~GILI01026029.1.p1  ORF type:complete len:538 (+),score=15.51 GILI01026029.1:552-2165(+)